MASVWFIVAHFIGDYLLQNSWMSQRKTRNPVVAGLHALLYTIPYLIWFQVYYGDTPYSKWTLPIAAAWVAVTHMLLDYTRAPKYLIWLKDQVAPKGYRQPWRDVNQQTGYPRDQAAWMSVWLLIITDNTLHLIANLIAVWFVIQVATM